MFLTHSQGQHATQSARHRLIKKNSIQVILLSRDKRCKFYLWMLTFNLIYVLIAQTKNKY